MRELRFCGWEHAESQVWALTGEQKAFLKLFRQRRKFVQEQHAYHAWLPQLEHVPKLIAEDEVRQVLLLSALPGEMLEYAMLSEVQLLNAYVQAGTLLRSLHDLPRNDDDPVLLSEAYQQRAESWVLRAQGYIARETCDWVSAHIEEAAGLFTALDVHRVPCHRDYTGRNWLVNVVGERLELSIIDFEHARPDFWLSDLEKLYLDGWEAELEAAFWHGYGTRPTAEERALFDKLGTLAAFTTIVWAREHQDDTFEAKGWRRLHELRRRLG